MKKCASYIIFTLLLAAIACACSDDIDMNSRLLTYLCRKN